MKHKQFHGLNKHGHAAAVSVIPVSCDTNSAAFPYPKQLRGMRSGAMAQHLKCCHKDIPHTHAHADNRRGKHEVAVLERSGTSGGTHSLIYSLPLRDSQVWSSRDPRVGTLGEVTCG